jgi:UDP-N-acetylmuramoyl-L-alanyl-D-glutamate--2,6-diaminopimelate ligase
MMLKQLLNGCEVSERSPEKTSCADRDISGVSYDSRNVKNGDLFVAIRGEKLDGHHFIRDVLGKGAVAVVHELPDAACDIGERGMHPSPCFIQVENSRKALACISNNFYRRPSEHLTLIGITGTNGKTTTSYILKSILEVHGQTTGLIGTIHYIIKEKLYSALHTTPESPEFQSLLHTMLASGCRIVVSEVSSHALAQYRVDGAVFHTAVFTNLTRDHLDFHKTMEEYYRAKQRLFSELLARDGTAVINIDDQYGRRLASRLQSDGFRRCITFGIASEADIAARDINNTFDGLRFVLSFGGKCRDVSSPLVGGPNVYNILSAAGAAFSLGVPWEVILRGIEKAKTVAGRFEKVHAGQSFLCIVDYAHTEDALERLISTARGLLSTPGGRRGGNSIPDVSQPSPRIITVFGCGGDRDRGKRPVMGAIATRLSDVVIITSDNPRSEDPAAIIREIEEGAEKKDYLIEPDRKEAIRKAVDMADDGDIVLVAGKGHEDYQEIRGVRHDFDDREVLKKMIQDRLRIHHAK